MSLGGDGVGDAKVETDGAEIEVASDDDGILSDVLGDRHRCVGHKTLPQIK